MDEIHHLLAVQNELGEGPLWNPVDQSLYWVDLTATCYHRLHPASGLHEVVEVGDRIGALAFRSGGGLLLAAKHGFAFWDPVVSALQYIVDPEADKPNKRFNDGAVDRGGRFWAGTTGDFYNNHLYRLDPDLSVHRMESGIDISNGIGWSPDNKVMYTTDSSPALIYAYDFDFQSGVIANRRVFIDSSDCSGVPDGLTVDSQGFIWSARWGGWRIERYDPTGKLERSIAMPVEYPTSVMFGGPDLDLLYVTSARIDVPKAERPQRPLDGDLFCLQPGVTGLPEPFFST
jgi:L-arabinonolactonase